jgi:hypothetical protein
MRHFSGLSLFYLAIFGLWAPEIYYSLRISGPIKKTENFQVDRKHETATMAVPPLH